MKAKSENALSKLLWQEYIKAWNNNPRVTKTAWARRLGVSREYLNNLLEGRNRNLGIKKCERIAKALKMSLHDFLCASGLIETVSYPTKESQPNHGFVSENRQALDSVISKISKVLEDAPPHVQNTCYKICSDLVEDWLSQQNRQEKEKPEEGREG